jgi:hypothetical protein
MNLTTSDKDNIYDYLSLNKEKFIYKKNESDSIKLLNSLVGNFCKNLEFETLKECFNFLTQHWDKKCKNLECLNDRKITSLFPNREDFLLVRKKYGIYKFCYNSDCNYKYISDRQTGGNNTCHRMTDDSFRSMCEKNSKRMKQNIKEGKFIPNITNSWARSRCEISFIRNNKIVNIKTRSTWEAYFQLSNVNLVYEKVVIPYLYKNVEYNYIVDFVDFENKILYEIKPLSNKDGEIVKVKNKYAKKWCKQNGYRFILITDRWFNMNYNEQLVIGQPDGEKILKNLRQFKNENKKYKKNRLQR